MGDRSLAMVETPTRSGETILELHTYGHSDAANHRLVEDSYRESSTLSRRGSESDQVVGLFGHISIDDPSLESKGTGKDLPVQSSDQGRETDDASEWHTDDDRLSLRDLSSSSLLEGDSLDRFLTDGYKIFNYDSELTTAYLQFDDARKKAHDSADSLIKEIDFQLFHKTLRVDGKLQEVPGVRHQEMGSPRRSQQYRQAHLSRVQRRPQSRVQRAVPEQSARAGGLGNFPEKRNTSRRRECRIGRSSLPGEQIRQEAKAAAQHGMARGSSSAVAVMMLLDFVIPSAQAEESIPNRVVPKGK